MPDPLSNPYAVPLLAWRAWGGALAVLLMSGAWGWAALGAVRDWGLARAERAMLWTVSGLGLFAVAALGCGQFAGGFSFSYHLAMLAVACAARLICEWRSQKKCAAKMRGGREALQGAAAPAAGGLPASGGPAQQEIWPGNPAGVAARAARVSALLGYAGLALFFVCALLPRAFAPPTDYDALEYHMAVIPHWFQLGRIAPLPHVFYSAQPCATEIWLGLAARAEGTPWGFAPGALQWLLAALGAACLLAALRNWLVPAACRPWCALAFLAHPVVLATLSDRLTDFTGALYLACGLWVSALAERREEQRMPLPRRAVPLALGALAGCALGAKWTNAGTVALPLLLLAAAQTRRRAWLAVATCGVAWLPWGAWLMAARGNPFAPFMARLFPTPAWGAAQLEFLMRTHGHTQPWRGEYWLNLAQRLTAGVSGAPWIAIALLTAAITALACARAAAAGAIPAKMPARGAAGIEKNTLRRPLSAGEITCGAMAAGLLAGALLWGQLLNAAERFLAPSFCLAIAFIARLAFARGVRAAWPRWAAGAALLALAGAALWGFQLAALQARDAFAWPHALGRVPRLSYLRHVMGLTPDCFAAANRLPSSARLLTVNEARGYYMAGNVDAVSVFDRTPLRGAIRGARSADEIGRRLRGMGYTHLLVNEFEMGRLLSVHRPPALIASGALDEFFKRPDTPENQLELARQFCGYTEFATEPLTDVERTIYREFLETLAGRAQWRGSGSPLGRPAIWLARL